MKTGAGDVRIRLVAMRGPADALDETEPDEDEPQFITPQPPLDWTDGYDNWIVQVGRKLGVDVSEPCDETGYENAMASAAAELQQRLPSLRARFLKGMEGLNLGFKIGLTTRKGGKEYVWVRPTEWKDPSTVECILECQPRDCRGFKLGQKLNLPISDLLDYCVGSETAGVVEPGLTQRIAEDFGLIIS